MPPKTVPPETTTPPIKQRLYFNGRFLSQRLTGVQRYAYEFIRACDTLAEQGQLETLWPGVQLCLLCPPNARDDLELLHVERRQVGRLRGQLWEQLELPYYSRDGLLLNLCNTFPLFKSQQASTLHDAAIFARPEAYTWAFRRWYRLLFPLAARRNLALFTDSQFSRRELSRYTGIAAERWQVVYLGHEHIFDVPADDGVLERHTLRPQEFLLAVGSLSPHKNFQAVVQALESLPEANFPVAIAGGSDAAVFAGKPQLSQRVKQLGYVSDGELRALYEHASAFIFPSRYEGFGFPPLEAMACGCPVIASQAASLPEVCGEAVRYCDPEDISSIAEAIEHVMHNPALRTELRERGYTQAAKFRWLDCASTTLQHLKTAVNARMQQV